MERALLDRCALVILHWLCLAAEADDLEEKRGWLRQVLHLDPDNETTTLALLLLDQRRTTS